MIIEHLATNETMEQQSRSQPTNDKSHDDPNNSSMMTWSNAWVTFNTQINPGMSKQFRDPITPSSG
jgi:hypothetical protein